MHNVKCLSPGKYEGGADVDNISNETQLLYYLIQC